MNIEELFKEFKKSQEASEGFVKATKDFSDEIFISTICLTLEIGCAKRGLNVIDVAQSIAKMVKEVNEDLGEIQLSKEEEADENEEDDEEDDDEEVYECYEGHD